MQLFIARQLFIFAMYMFHARIGKAMAVNADIFVQTMDLVDSLFTGTRRDQWKLKVCNLTESYMKEIYRG